MSEQLSDTRQYVTFTGGESRKFARTGYTLEFISSKEETVVYLTFQEETTMALFGKLTHLNFLPLT